MPVWRHDKVDFLNRFPLKRNTLKNFRCFSWHLSLNHLEGFLSIIGRKNKSAGRDPLHRPFVRERRKQTSKSCMRHEKRSHGLHLACKSQTLLLCKWGSVECKWKEARERITSPCFTGTILIQHPCYVALHNSSNRNLTEKSGTLECFFLFISPINYWKASFNKDSSDMNQSSQP